MIFVEIINMGFDLSERRIGNRLVIVFLKFSRYLFFKNKLFCIISQKIILPFYIFIYPNNHFNRIISWLCVKLYHILPILVSCSCYSKYEHWFWLKESWNDGQSKHTPPLKKHYWLSGIVCFEFIWFLLLLSFISRRFLWLVGFLYI